MKKMLNTYNWMLLLIKAYAFLQNTIFQQQKTKLKNYALGPKKSGSSSKTTHIVLFPGLNSPIQVNVPQQLCLN